MQGEDEQPPLLVDVRDLEDPEDDFEPSPVTVVTGYLGSGKSTLLKHITSTAKNKRIAIVLNEFGQTSDIERSLAVRNTDQEGLEVEQWVELDNGCMCCTAKDAGVAAIEKLMERQGRFDHIIIETSGLADPAPIAGMFWLDDALMARVKLDGVVTVVDAQTIMRSLDEGPLASLQIACSDLIVVNKCETVSSEALVEVKRRVQEINGAASQIQCSYGNVPANKLLELQAYSRSGLAVGSFMEVHPTSDSPAAHVNHDLSTVVVPLAILASKQLFREFEAKLQHLLWVKELNGHSFEIHRVKGKLQCLAGNEHNTKIVQGVRETYEITNIEYEPEGECKLVLIGRSILPIRQAISDMLTLADT